jgi:colanic acid/amylovoran biosynthesis protein
MEVIKMRVYLDALSHSPAVSIGTQSFIIGSMQIIAKCFNNTEFVMLSSFPELEKNYLDKEPYNVKIVKRSNSQLGTIRQILSVTKEVDFVVSAWGDGYITTPSHKLINKTFILKLRGKPLILFPSSLGPFQGKLKSYISKKGLSKFDKIMARDTVTFRFFKGLGLKNIYLIPDTAFILDPADENSIQEIFLKENVKNVDNSMIGLNVSQLLNCLFKDKLGLNYAKFISEIVIYLHGNFKKHILLVPHQIYPVCLNYMRSKSQMSYDGDDRCAIMEVMEYIRDKEIATPLKGEYSAREYKGIINKCEIFIGGRMHSIIAAISLGIPSVIMQYSHKAQGVMDMLGMEEYVWDIKSTKEELLSKINKAWYSRDVLRNDLKYRVVKIKDEVWKAGDLLKETISSKRKIC